MVTDGGLDISDQGETIRSVRLKEREGIGREERAKMDRKKEKGKTKSSNNQS